MVSSPAWALLAQLHAIICDNPTHATAGKASFSPMLMRPGRSRHKSMMEGRDRQGKGAAPTSILCNGWFSVLPDIAASQPTRLMKAKPLQAGVGWDGAQDFRVW